MTHACIKHFVDDFVRSEFVANWTADNDNQGYGSGLDRFTRVYDAAEHGAYGATHAEIIGDWRDALDSYLEHLRILPNTRDVYYIRRTSRPYRIEVCYLDRLRAAAHAHFDSVEAWHEKNGSLWEEIG
jgi:hypothetical protein